MNNFKQNFDKAIACTNIIKTRQSNLFFASNTELPYILLSESEINKGDTVVRKGKVEVTKPVIFVPGNGPDFDGFTDGDVDADVLEGFAAIGRFASFPKGKYDLIEHDMSLFDGNLQKAVDFYQKQLDDDEYTGLCTCPTDVWSFSLFHYVGSAIHGTINSDVSDIKRRMGL